jgi:DNA-binding transcriptional MerR regulator
MTENKYPDIDVESLTKLYYSIGEVADMFQVSKSLIRYWETEFPSLKPHKNSKGDRRFTKQNIEQIIEIYHLVKEKGYTLEGAKQELKSSRRLEKEKELLLLKLQQIKEGLLRLRKGLDGA